MHGETPSQVVRLIYWCGDVPRLGSPHQWGSPGWGSPGGVSHLPIYPTVVVPYPDRYNDNDHDSDHDRATDRPRQ